MRLSMTVVSRFTFPPFLSLPPGFSHKIRACFRR
jgi:hypothetical protein